MISPVYNSNAVTMTAMVDWAVPVCSVLGQVFSVDQYNLICHREFVGWYRHYTGFEPCLFRRGGDFGSSTWLVTMESKIWLKLGSLAQGLMFSYCSVISVNTLMKLSTLCLSLLHCSIYSFPREMCTEYRTWTSWILRIRPPTSCALLHLWLWA